MLDPNAGKSTDSFGDRKFIPLRNLVGIDDIDGFGRFFDGLRSADRRHKHFDIRARDLQFQIGTLIAPQ